MSKYLARLRACAAPKIPPSVSSVTEVVGRLSKMTSPSVSFVSAPGGHAQKSASDNSPGEFWPWAPYLSANDVQRFRAELVEMIERLAELEEWGDEHRDDVLARAIRAPLADLLPNMAHFRERLDGALAEAKARDAMAARSWRFDR